VLTLLLLWLLLLLLLLGYSALLNNGYVLPRHCPVNRTKDIQVTSITYLTAMGPKILHTCNFTVTLQFHPLCTAQTFNHLAPEFSFKF
jgi:hypothetical protein